MVTPGLSVFSSQLAAEIWAASSPSFERNSPIARRRFLRPQDQAQRGPAINERIRAKRIRLIDDNNEMIGVVDTVEAMRRAYDAGLDLVEVASDSNPPVCRILDYGKYKYELAKKEKANRAKSKTAELKEVRMGRSMKIDPHDIKIRINQARKFLLEGHKVQIVQNFRGREMIHRDRGNQRMQDIIDQLEDIAKVETPPRMMGRRMTMIFAPDKPKIEAYKRKKADEDGKKAESAGNSDSDAPAAKEKPAKKKSETNQADPPDGNNRVNRAANEAEVHADR